MTPKINGQLQARKGMVHGGFGAAKSHAPRELVSLSPTANAKNTNANLMTNSNQSQQQVSASARFGTANPLPVFSPAKHKVEFEGQQTKEIANGKLRHQISKLENVRRSMSMMWGSGVEWSGVEWCC